MSTNQSTNAKTLSAREVPLKRPSIGDDVETPSHLTPDAQREHSPGPAKTSHRERVGLRLAAPGRPPRAGKITRMPVEIREELNERLYDGELGPDILDWLNGLPEVRSVMDTWFDGADITKQNLSQWRHGGYQDWLARREEREILELVARGTAQVKTINAQFAANPAPELADIMALQRTLIYLLTAKAKTEPALLDKVMRLTKPIIKFAELEEKRRKNQLAEEKYRDQIEERKRAIEAEKKAAEGGNVITEETIERIERELNLF